MSTFTEFDEEDVAGVSAVIERFQIAGRAGDLDRFMDCFEDDAIWMLDDRPQDAGKDEAREYFSFLNESTFDQKVTKDEIQIFGNWAFARVTFDGHLIPKPGVDAESYRVFSRHFMVFKRQSDNTWKLARDMWVMPSDG